MLDPRLTWSTDHRIGWMIHILGIILWIGGLLYLTRLMLFHSKNATTDETHALMVRLEKRLFFVAVTPGLILALTGGIWCLLAYNMPSLKMGWFHAKLFIAVVFIAIQYVCMNNIFALEKGPPGRQIPMVFWLHHLLSLLLLLVLILIRFRPF